MALFKQGEGAGVTASAAGVTAHIVTEELSGMGGWQVFGVDTVMSQ